jgi:hypothetical protein
VLIAADDRWFCAVGETRSIEAEHRGLAPDRVLALVLEGGRPLRDAFSDTDVLEAALSDLFDKRRLDWLAQAAAHVPAGSAHLHQVLAGDEPERFSGSVLAGRSALTFAPGVAPEMRQHVLRMWVSRLRPATALRAYAALAARRAAAVVPLLTIAQLPPAGTNAAVAWEFRDGSWAEAGGLRDGRWWGVLDTCEVVETRTVRLPSRTIYVAHGIAAVPNLAAPRLGDDADPADICLGVDDDAEIAFAKCRSEGRERFALGDVRADQLVHSSAVGLDMPFIAPNDVFAYNEAQHERHGLVPFSPEQAEYWACGERIDGTPVAIPAALVFSPFPRPAWLAPGAQSSNGAAAGRSIEDARRRAWCELVERDAFIRAWRGGGVPERIEATGPASELAAWLHDEGVDVILLDLPSPTGIACVCAVGMAPEGIHVGAAAGSRALSPAKALSEVLVQHLFPSSRRVEAAHVRTPADHCGYWIGRVDDDLERFLSGRSRGPLLSGADLGERIPCANTAFITLTPDESPVVKAVATDLIPMTFGYDAEPLLTYRKHLGAASAGPLTPHPFA